MGTLALLCLGLLVALVVLRSLRRIAPDSVLVFFTDAARTKISRWQQGGLAFAWPWQATGRLELTAVSLEIAVDAPPPVLDRRGAPAVRCGGGGDSRLVRAGLPAAFG